jgi:hypothetical protein
MDMRFGTSHVISLYRAGSLGTASKERSKYKLDLMGVQEGNGTEVAGEYTFFYRRGNGNRELSTGVSCIRESYYEQ